MLQNDEGVDHIELGIGECRQVRPVVDLERTTFVSSIQFNCFLNHPLRYIHPHTPLKMHRDGARKSPNPAAKIQDSLSILREAQLFGDFHERPDFILSCLEKGVNVPFPVP